MWFGVGLLVSAEQCLGLVRAWGTSKIKLLKWRSWRRYRQKRHERNFNKRIKYMCRKTLADSRPRVRGRFARNDDAAAVMPHETKKALAEKARKEKKGARLYMTQTVNSNCM